MIGTHAFVHAYALQDFDQSFDPDGPAFLFTETTQTLGNGRLDTGLVVGSGFNGATHYGGAARAITSPFTGTFLRAGTSSHGTGIGLFDPIGFAQSRAAWRDVVVLSGPLPPTIRLNFRVDGFFEGDILREDVPDLTSMNSRLEVGWTTSPTGWLEVLPSVPSVVNLRAEVHHSGAIRNGLQTSGAWDTAGLIYGDPTQSEFAALFDGSFHIDVPYNPTLGGYAFGIALTTRSTAVGMSVVTDFLGTLSLESATLTDGTPIAATFDSGMQFGVEAAEVPEPSSVGLCILSSLVLLKQRRRRSAQPASA